MSNETELEEVRVDQEDPSAHAVITNEGDVRDDAQAAGYAQDLSWSPGMLLKRAREKRKMSREELSVQTKLSVSVVTALEADDFDTLSQAVYTRGYYRRCAGVLGLSADEVLKAYERASGEPPPQPLPLKPTAAQEEFRAPGRWMPYIVFVLVAACVVAGVMWWTQRTQPGQAQAPASGNAASAVQSSVPAKASGNGTATGSSAATGASGSASSGTAALPPLPTPAAGQGGSSADASSAAASAAATTQAKPASKPVQPKPAAASRPAPMPAGKATAAAAAPAAGGHALQLVFTHKSWVEVTDATGKTLLTGLMSSGATKVVHGKPPYDVLLGYAPGVKLSYAGHPVSLASQVRSNNTANLTVGSSH